MKAAQLGTVSGAMNLQRTFTTERKGLATIQQSPIERMAVACTPKTQPK